MISSNGYLTFGSSGNDYSNDPIPSSSQPNDIIAPYWDDLKPIGIYYSEDWGTVITTLILPTTVLLFNMKMYPTGQALPPEIQKHFK